MTNEDPHQSGRPHERPSLRLGIQVNARTSGGGQVFAHNLVNALSDQAEPPRITLFVAGEGRQSWPDDVKVVGLGPRSGSRSGRLWRRRQLKAALAANPVDVLLCPGTEVTKIGSTPTIVWPLTVAPFEDEALRILGDTMLRRLRWLLLRALVRRAFGSADAAVYSSAHARDVHRKFIARARTIPSYVVHPAASLQPTRTDSGTDFGTATSASQVTAADRPLLFVSHLYPYKMVVEMVEGYAIASRANRDIPRLLIAGRATQQDYAEKIDNTIRAEGMQDRITMLGDLDQGQLAAAYRSARAFIFPSMSENAGSYALIDAFAHGLPVISSDASSMPEICGDAALYFDPRRPAELADRIGQLLTSPALEKRMRLRSAQRFGWFPTWDGVADAFLQHAWSAFRSSRSAEVGTSL